MRRKVRVNIAIAFGISLTAQLVAYFIVGPTLGLFFAGIVLAAILVPPLCSNLENRAAILTAAAVTHAIAIVWLIALFTSLATYIQWIEAYIVLIAFAAAILWIARAAARVNIPPAVTTIAAIAWLSWPVWLAPYATTSIVAVLTPAHPLFALNHIFIDQGIWTQQRLMYDATTLGQDVPFSLPTSIIACVIAHGIIALALMWIATPRQATTQEL